MPRIIIILCVRKKMLLRITHNRDLIWHDLCLTGTMFFHCSFLPLNLFKIEIYVSHGLLDVFTLQSIGEILKF